MKKWINDNLYIYGETGERLSGVRSSDIYKNSANGITDFDITELGTLEVAKQFDSEQYTTTTTQKMFNSEYEHYILVNISGTTLTVTTIEKDSYEVIDTATTTAQYGLVHWNYFDGNLIFIENEYKTQKSWLIDEDGNISASNFWDTIILPASNQSDFEIDIYRIYGTTAKLLGSYTNPAVNTDTNGYLYLGSSQDIHIKRIYLDYKERADDFNSPVDGEYYGVIKNYEYTSGPYVMPTPYYFIKNDYFYFDNTNFINDSSYGGYYVEELYSDLTFQNEVLLQNASGTTGYGTIIDFDDDINNQLVTSCVYQNRLFLMTKDTVYASRLFDFNDFRNGTDSSDPFYLQPTPVNGESVTIYKSVAGEGLYIGCKDTIYLLGFQTQLTPSESISSLRIVSRIGVSPFINSMVTINKDMYYRDEDRRLMAIQASYASGILEFLDTKVDKYFDYEVRGMTAYHKNGEDFILVLSFGGALLYKKLYDNVFQRRTKTITVDGYVFFTDNKIFQSENVLTESDDNVNTAILEMHRADLSTNKGGIYLNDWASLVTRVIINLYCDNKDAIKNVFIAYGDGLETQWSNLLDADGVHKIETSFKVSDDYQIKIITNETDDKIELRGINTLIDANGE